MSAKPNYLKIGSFILSGAALLAAALLALGARTLVEKKTIYETYISENVEGLSLGAPVKLRGVPVGKVTRIAFTWNQYPQSSESYVLVEFEVGEKSSLLPPSDHPETDLNREIDKGLRVRVKGQGITGLSILSLEYVADSSKLPISWQPRNAYIPSVPGQFDQMLASIERSLRKIENIDFETISSRVTTNLVSLQDLLDQTRHVNLVGITSNANQLVEELRFTNLKLQTLLTNADSSINTMNLGKLSDNTAQMIAEITRVSERLSAVIDSVDTSPVNETLINARAATANLNEAIETLKQYPSSFLFGKEPPPAKSVKPASKP
jgi:ABC-type transporter Mla subunit MlaD